MAGVQGTERASIGHVESRVDVPVGDAVTFGAGVRVETEKTARGSERRNAPQPSAGLEIQF